MDLSNLEISVDTVISTLASRVAELEREKAVLVAQREALVKKLEEKEEA